MNKIIYSVLYNDGYEFYEMGLYSSIPKAKQACTAHFGKGLTWNDRDDGSSISYPEVRKNHKTFYRPFYCIEPKGIDQPMK